MDLMSSRIAGKASENVVFDCQRIRGTHSNEDDGRVRAQGRMPEARLWDAIKSSTFVQSVMYC